MLCDRQYNGPGLTADWLSLRQYLTLLTKEATVAEGPNWVSSLDPCYYQADALEGSLPT